MGVFGIYIIIIIIFIIIIIHEVNTLVTNFQLLINASPFF